MLAMDFENDIINENGAFKDLGFAPMVKQSNVLGKTSNLLDAARHAGVKIIYVAAHFRPGHLEIPKDTTAGILQTILQTNALVEGTWGVEIDPPVAPKAGEIVVTNRGVSGFTGSDLDTLLHASGIRTLLLTGVATNFVVEGTAREAVDQGYNVVIVGDCCTSLSQEAHESALNTALPALTTISTSEEVIDALK